ncbi:putative DNA-binding protein [Bradyrhizobium diazoefficiens]|uniref:Putative DNA-binding protein n=1 Tax=Bradyrhizobium diazoefficiens TaxID=1355477 RepID=A0A0E4BQU4_9BRAD|nr:putative DNA-binding protein [Bradyrhizobium diazoefficiens]
MANSVRKITLSQSRDIPFNRLVLSQSNVRRIKAGISIEELAQDIARRTLLQSLTVRPVLDEQGAETGMFEIPAGGRRYRALELLVKQKRLARNAPVPCVIRTDGLAEEDSLAENIQRVPLAPIDQFCAFRDLVEKGRTEEEVAAAFFVSVSVVKQRLRLAAVSPALLGVYAEDGMSLDQLMAFAVNPDHARQEQVWEAVQRSHNKEPYYIRRLLTEGAVRATDKRAQFVGIEAYEAAGGDLIRDLFQQDDGGWLQEPMLLDRLVAEKLEREAANIRSEGWKWVEVAIDFPYGHIYGLRRISGEPVAMTDEEVAAAAALRAEYEGLEQEHSDVDVLPEGIDQRLGEIETALAELDDRPVQYDPDEIARGCLRQHRRVGSASGRARLRPSRDEPTIPEPKGEADAQSSATPAASSASGDPAVGQTGTSATAEVPDQEDGIKPIPDRLMTELTAYRTLALREALAGDPDVAFLAALHALCLKLFYRYTPESCLDIDAKSIVFGSQAPGLGDATIAKAVDERHRRWSEQLPRESAELWDALANFDRDSRDALFAHCIALSINAVYEPWNRRPRALAHADRLAEAIGLNLAAAGWTPTVDNYLGRVTKARILQSVREAKGDTAAQRIEHLKKGEMAEKAQELLAGSGWLPGRCARLVDPSAQHHRRLSLVESRHPLRARRRQ